MCKKAIGKKNEDDKIKTRFVADPAKSRADPGGVCLKKKKKTRLRNTTDVLFSRRRVRRDHQSPRRGRRVTTLSPPCCTAASSRAEFPRVRQWSRRLPVTYPSPRCPLSATCWRRRCSPAPATATLLDGRRPDRLAARRCWSRSTAAPPPPVLLQPRCNDFRWSHQ